MSDFLFLEGNSGEGKTTMLFDCLKPWKMMTGGFYSQRLIDDKGLTAGFRMVSAAEDWRPAISYRAGLSNVFIERLGTGWEKSLEFFENKGVDILKTAEGKKLCLMDEIGGIDLSSPGFMEAVFEYIDGVIPCIGVLKSRKNFRSMSERVPVRPEADRLRDELEAELRKRTKGRILTFERDHADRIRMEIMEFLKENLKE